VNDLVFHPIWSIPWLIAAAAFALALIFWSLRRGVRSRGRAVTLGLLRTLALAVLLLMLAQPQLRREEITTLRPQLAVLVDNTQSMTERVDAAQPTRATRAAEWMKALAPQAKDFDVRLFGFDAAPSEEPAWESLKFDGGQSRISASVARLKEHFRGQPLAAILLLSDGLDRADASHAESAADATAAPLASGTEAAIPVFTFELETPFAPKPKPKKVSLANLDYPPRIVIGWDTEVRAAIAARGLNGQTVHVELWREGVKAADTAVAFNQDEQTRQVAFPVSQSSPGAVHYELRVADPAADADAKKSPFVIEAMEPGNRILYIQNTLGFDFKFLRKAILGDRNLQLAAFVRWADGRLVNIAAGGGAQAPALDLSPQALAGTAVVILGDIAPDSFTPEQCQALAAFVDHGGGLVLLGGPHSLAAPGFATSALAPLLPVKLPAEYREGNFPMKITDTGLHHPVFGSLFTSIGDFPPLLTLNAATTVAPTAEVLVETPASPRPAPAIVSMRHGQGRVIVILSDTLWRWRLAAKGWSSERSPYDTFWTQLMDWLIPKEQQKENSNRLELFTERAQYLSGEQPEIRAILRTRDPAAQPPATLPLQLRTPDGKTFDYTLKPAQFTGRDGKKVNGFRATVEPNVPGLFRAKATATVAGAAMEGETRFTVAEPPTELTGKPIDRNALKKIAQGSGGQYYDRAHWTQWRRDLHVTETHTSKIELNDRWNHPALIALLLLLLAADWTARKAWNLP